MSDLKGELASLRIDRDRAGPRLRRWPLFLFVPMILALGALYALRARQAFSAPEVDTVRASVVRSNEAAAGTPILTASGYVVARRKAVVSAKIQGRLSDLRVEEGSRVRQGEVIARLESGDYEAQVQRARAALQRAEADLAESNRQLDLARRLTGEKIMSLDQLQTAESRARVGEAAVSQARADLAFAVASLANTVIRAPFTGTVVKKMAEVGESVAPIPPGVNISTSSGAIVALADLDTLEVEADVSESNVAKLSADQPAEVTVEAFPDRRYKAVLRQVIPTADRTKATVQVKVTILDKDAQLKPEMSAKVTFVEAARPAAAAEPASPVVVVPKEAVATRDGKPVVFEVLGNKVRSRAVVPAGERQGQVVLREGLAGSEMLVARPPDSLKDGDAVRVKG
ncbi:MAG: efflux RND transporter periplasmic adaptor subunit [Acidobacteria bacterium]|nr:MAG: efflux RND transporter periplasmic adaptor subunit [Acidobacteriota bacterium]